MVKISKSKEGLYTAKQACNRLGMKQGTFFYHVRTGKINKVVPPGATEGYYRRSEIDKIAQEQELFFLQYAVSPTSFIRASSEDDIRGIYDLTIAMYGQGGTPSLEARLDIWRKFPYTYYVLRQNDIVVGYISLIWFNHRSLAILMGQESDAPTQASAAGTGVYSVTGPENMIPFTPGKSIESIFISLGVRPGLTNSQQRRYGFKLLRDTVEVLEDFARRDMPVRKLYATSERHDGIKLARDMAMKETKYPGDPLLRFELDLETSDTPIAKQYQTLLRELKQERLQAPETPVSAATPNISLQRDKAVRTRPERASTPLSHASEESELPDGLIGLTEYARLRGIPPTTLKKAADTGRIPVVRGAWKKGKATVQIALDTDGRAKVDELYSKRQEPTLFDE